MALHNKALVLFDMSNFIHRSFHSLPVDKFKRADGMSTNALFGTTKLILSILNDFSKKYKHIFPVACFDTAKSKLNRMQIDAEYKGTRQSAPNELKHQFAWVREITEAMNITNIEMESQEADDIIASVAKENINKYDEIIIVSTDKDFNQCLKYSNVKIYNLAKKDFVTGDDVIDKFGVPPAYFTLYQALVGDKIDNIKGVKGIGAKVAPLLVQQANGKIENIIELANTGELKKNKSHLIIEYKNDLETSHQLVTLNENLNLNLIINEITMIQLKINKIFAKYLDQMGFSSIKKKYCV